MTLSLSSRWRTVIVIDGRRSSVKTKGWRELALPMTSKGWRMLGRHGGVRRYVPPRARAITLFLLAASLVGTPSVAAQRDEAQASGMLIRAAETITAVELRQQMAMLDADSMRPHATPSRELERAAHYLASEFQRLDLTPAGDAPDNPWFQRYPVPGQWHVNLQESKLLGVARVRAHGRPITSEAGEEVYKQTTVMLATDARFVPGIPMVALPEGYTGHPDHFMLVAGPQSAASLQRPELRNNLAVYVPPSGLDVASRQAVIATLAQISLGALVVSAGASDSADDAARVDDARRAAPPQAVPLVNAYLRYAGGRHTWPWALQVRPGVLDGLLSTVGADPADLRAATQPIVREISSAMVDLIATPDTTTPMASASALNVVARLEGRDSVLKRESLVVMAALDAASTASAAALVALAQAWSRPEARPRRSVVFLATSGNAPSQAHWGSNFFVTSSPPEVPLGGVIGLLALENLTRGAGDSVVVDGAEDLVLTEPPAWVAALHPELGLTLVDGGTAFTAGTAPFAFACRGIPTLALHRRTEPAGTASGEPSRRDEAPGGEAGTAAPDAAWLASALRLVFYVGHVTANAKSYPRWSVAGRRRFLDAREP